MQIQLKKQNLDDYETLEIKPGTSLEALYLNYKKELPRKVVASNVDNKTMGLDFIIEKPCKVKFLDLSTQMGSWTYQRSLSLMYIKAAKDILGDAPVIILNSLNRGLYTEIRTKAPLTEDMVKAVQNQMQKLVKQDLPIIDKGGTEEVMDPRREFSIDGFSVLMSGPMVPRTGYLDIFELRKYKRGVILRFPTIIFPDGLPDYIDEEPIYKAFSEVKRWQKLLGIESVKDLNKKIETHQMKELVQLTEALHEHNIVEIANRITEEKKRIILIAGPSSSGKTTFSRRLGIQLRVNGLNPLNLGTDDYFVERSETPRDEDGELDFENLKAMDVDLFTRDMNDLLSGKKVDLPQFDFLKGTKVFGKRMLTLEKDRPIIIEGIHALNSAMTAGIPDEVKFKIYISPLTQLSIDEQNRMPVTYARLLRRIVRDHNYRGYGAKETIKMWPKVRFGENRNIFPYTGEADALFNSMFSYEMPVMKKYALPLLKSIKPEDPEYPEASRLISVLSFFETYEDVDTIPNNSIIREFIGGSVFVD